MGTGSMTPGLERQPVDQSTCQDDQLAMSAICWKHNGWVERVQWRTDPWELMLGNWSAGRWALGGSATTDPGLPASETLRLSPSLQAEAGEVGAEPGSQEESLLTGDTAASAFWAVTAPGWGGLCAHPLQHLGEQGGNPPPRALQASVAAGTSSWCVGRQCGEDPENPA